MANNAIETVMGAVVLAVAGSFLYFAYSNSSVKPIEGYAVNAAFTNISGISPGSAVRVGGIKIGVVEKLSLDPKNFRAMATLRLGNEVALPKDSSAAVQSTGLIGDKFIAIEPGGDDKNLADGDVIAYTQPSVSIEEMIGKFVFSGGGADKGGKPADAKPATAAAAPSLSDPLDAVAMPSASKPAEAKPAAKPAAKTAAKPAETPVVIDLPGTVNPAPAAAPAAAK